MSDIVPIAKQNGRKRHPWISSEIVTLSRKKNRAYKAALRSGTNNNLWDKYKKLRNDVKYLIRQSYCSYVHDMAINSASNPKQFWSFVNSKRCKSAVRSFHSDNGNLRDPTRIAQNFNHLFQSNFINVSCNHNEISCDHFITNFRLGCISTNIAEVKQLLSQLNMYKSAGPDGISPMLLKLACNSLALPLTKLFNMSLSSGLVPHEWKLAHVVPLFKSGDAHNMSNYRPISLCSVVGKTLERIISKHVINHMYKGGIISPTQHGFLPKRSCVTQLTTLYHSWANILDATNPPRIDAIFLDWSKAFDRVNHHILLNKLHKYGICGSVLNWFQSYLTNRSQRVQFMGSYSDWAAVHSGVPQGSVLGPLLFNIFAFDLPFCVQSNLRQYADDTVLYRTIKHQDDQLALQNDLQHLHNWCNLNYMELNSGKCKVMAVTRSRNPPSPVYTIGDHDQ